MRGDVPRRFPRLNAGLFIVNRRRLVRSFNGTKTFPSRPRWGGRVAESQRPMPLRVARSLGRLRHMREPYAIASAKNEDSADVDDDEQPKPVTPAADIELGFLCRFPLEKQRLT
jgi:hypothetical protein